MIKLITLLLIVPLLQVSALALAQNITLSKSGANLSEVFDEISRQTDYDFIYSIKQLQGAKRITISTLNASIRAVLDQCFARQPFTYTIKDKTITVVPKKLSVFDKIIQRFNSIDVRGTIVDENDLPLAGATVKIKGSFTSVSTDQQGAFYIPGLAENAILVISYTGYQNREITASANLGTIKLELSSAELKEIEINAGYYTVKDKERTGSISRVTAETISKQPVSNPLAALIGRMPGVNIEQQNGINGGGYTVEIRGKNSLRESGRQPLYLIDGIPYPGAPIANLALSGQGLVLSPLNNLSPSEIESIEVLKDADATAIYGSRGSNGVILITTKRAKAGRTALNINASTGISKISNKINLLNTPHYLEMRNEAFSNDNTQPGLADYDVNGTWAKTKYTDWQEVLIGETASNTNLQASLSGGNEFTQFSLRGNYNRQTTVTPGDHANKKGSASMSMNHFSPDKRFTLNFSVGYSIDKNDLPRADLASFINLAPNAPDLYDVNGNLNWAPNDMNTATWSNPLAMLLQPFSIKTNSLISSGRLNYELISGLFISSSFGYTSMKVRETQLSPILSMEPSQFATGSNEIAFNTIENWIAEPQINYQKKIGSGKLDMLIGITFQKEDQKAETLSGYGYTTDLLLESITSAPIKFATSSAALYKYNALFGRINYNYSGKYLLNLTARRDGSSRFGPDKQFANFVAAGLAWVFSNEALVKKALPGLSFGKLRGSYGTTGSDQIPNYGYLETYSATQPYQDGSGLFPSRIANPDYSWETNRKLEAALDLGFMDDRIMLSATWYRNRSSNQLVGYTLPDLAGFPSIQYNLPAKVQNTGWEFEVNTSNIANRYLTWKSSVNLTVPKNKLLAYPNLGGSTYVNTYTVGASLYTPRAYQYLGVDPQTGLYNFRDLNGNGLYENADRTPAPKSLTSHFFGGIQNSVTFKRFEIDLFFQFVKKTAKNPMYEFGAAGSLGNQPIAVMNRWKNAGDNTDFQKFSQSFESGGAVQRFSYLSNSDRYSDASFIRLKNISISWTLPPMWLQSAMINSMRIYLQGQNLLTITNYLGDPEVGSIRRLPTLATITAGIQLSL